MKVSETKLKEVLLIEPEPFRDHRGYYLETYNRKLYTESGIKVDFIQDDISVSAKGVLRGIHGDHLTWKLISCPEGEFYFVVVDCRSDSENFGKWQAFTLSEKNMLQVLVAPGYGNAHLVLSERAIFHYKQSTYYDRSKQFTYKWDDDRFNIIWPIKEPILSERDK